MKRINNNIKNENIKKNNRIVLIKLLLIVAVSIVIAIMINQKDKVISNITLNKEEVSESADNKVLGTQTDKFNGVPLINDNRGVPVICYHYIGEDPTGKSPLIISKEKLRDHLKTIKDDGYTTLTMEELNNYLFKDEPIPEKSVVITFDDGSIDNYTNAFPILKEFNVKATMYVISGDINQSEFLTSDQIKEMSDYGIDIESHTVSHRKLSTLSYEEQLKELKDSKEAIEKITGKPIIAVAYPEGKFNEDTKKATIEAGYTMGFTIDRGYADRSDNAAQLNRICVDYTYKPRNIEKILISLPK